MDNKRELDQLLSSIDAPPPREGAKKAAIDAAMAEFEALQQEKEISSAKNSQGSANAARPSHTGQNWISRLFGRKPMTRKIMLTGTAFASLAALGLLIFNVSQQKVGSGGIMMAAFDTQNESAARREVSDMRQNKPAHVSGLLRDGEEAPMSSGGKGAADYSHSSEGLSMENRIASEPSYGDRVDMPASAPPATVAAPAPKQEFAEAEMDEMAAMPEKKRMAAPAEAQAVGRTRAQSTLTKSKSATMRLKEQIAPGIAGPAGMDDSIVSDKDYVGKDAFEDFKINPVKVVAEEPVSTFSIDVDTASYSFVRRQLNSGVLPQKDAVRLEEMINYFDYDYAVPDTPEEPFQPTVAVYPSPWKDGAQLLHVGIKGLDIPEGKEPPLNLVFLLDTSGSMQSADKLGLLKDSFRLLVEQLDENDTVSIVTYAGSAGTVLEPTSGDQKAKIISAIESLRASGSTAGAEGIRQAYTLAESGFEDSKLNRVILATDGDFNVGITNQEELKDFVERKRDNGVFLSVLGFGQGNYKDSRMQALAQNGNGNAYYIDNLNEARKVLVDDITATMFPIAKDVKIQIEFNPAQVAEYRLIGYETRMLDREDFNNDKIDAGEIGAGHTMTAIYEIVAPDSGARMIDAPRYSGNAAGAEQEDGGLFGSMKADENFEEIAFLKMRYKLPGEDTSRLITRPIGKDDTVATIDEVAPDIRFAASVAAFGQILKGGEYTGDFDLDDTLALARGGLGEDKFGYRAEFLNLIRLAKTARAMDRQ